MSARGGAPDSAAQAVAAALDAAWSATRITCPEPWSASLHAIVPAAAALGRRLPAPLLARFCELIRAGGAAGDGLPAGPAAPGGAEPCDVDCVRAYSVNSVLVILSIASKGTPMYRQARVFLGGGEE